MKMDMKPGPDSRRGFLGKAATGLAVAVAAPQGVLAAHRRLRIAIIGAGDRGVELAIEAAACKDVEIAAFADVHSRRLETASAIAPQARLTSDYRRLLDDSSLDAVLIATPPHLHAAQFEDSLTAGKHVYIENVMALNVDDGKRMRRARQATPKLAVQVGHQSCSWAMLRDAVEFTAPSRIGQITAIRARLDRNTPHGRPLWARPIYPDINAATLDWQAFQGAPATDSRPFDATRYVNWRYFWDYSQGQVSEGMSHQLAFLTQALSLGIPPAVTMTGGLYRWNDGREVPDTMTVSMDFGNLLFTWDSGSGNGHYGSEEAVLGTGATVIKNQQIAWIPQKVTRPPSQFKDLAITRRPINEPRAHIENFFAAIRNQAKPNCPFETGFQTSIACRMAVESLWSGRTVRWDANLEQIV